MECYCKGLIRCNVCREWYRKKHKPLYQQTGFKNVVEDFDTEVPIGSSKIQASFRRQDLKVAKNNQ